jgi:hypothetical protein
MRGSKEPHDGHAAADLLFREDGGSRWHIDLCTLYSR